MVCKILIGEGIRGIFEQWSGKNAVDFCFLPSRITVVKIRAENLMKNTELFLIRREYMQPPARDMPVMPFCI